jgi:PAS domain S-box-containing protein
LSDSNQENLIRTIHQLFSGLRFRLVLLVVLAALPPVVLTLRIARQDRQRQTAALRQRSQDIVKLAARKEDEMIAGTRQLLRAVAESAQVQSAQWGNCNKLLRTLFADYPRYICLGVIKTNGEVSASAPALTEPINLADRAFFQRTLTMHDLSIGEYQIGRITGRPGFSIAYPVFDPSGQVQAVVFAALDLDWVNRSDYALQMLLPQGATWTKIDGKGTILVRYPAPETSLVGMPLPEKSLFNTLSAQTNGVMEAVDRKGVSVFYDYTSTRSALVADDVISILSIPRKVLFAEPDRVMMRNLTSVAIVAGLVLVIGWIGSRYLVLRPIQALVNSTARLGTGDHSARTGLPAGRDELRQLTRAFDQMAEALQQRETERQSAANALKASEMRYRRLFETAQDGILILNADTGKIDDVNPFLTDMLGYTREQLLGKKLWEIGPFKDTKASKEEFRELQREAYVRYDDLPLETSGGRSINVEFVSNVYHVNGGKVIQCNIRDITKRKQVEGKLKDSRRRLQVLSRRLVEAQESERRHIARELHDEIGQALTVTEMNLQALLESPGTDALAPRLRESLQVIERVQEQVHDLSLNLRPSMLDDLGLEPALRWYTKRQAALADLKAQVRAEPLEQRLDPMIETECFRVAQEALTNVVKHAKARTVTVELTQSDEQLHLWVRDDGVGFDVANAREQAVRGASLGVLSMEERATLAGGGLQCHATPGHGTEVHAWFPLKWAHPAILIGAI